MNSQMTDLGAYIKSYLCGSSLATAGGTGDNTAVTGQEIDHLGYVGCKLIIGWQTALTSGQTLSLTVEYQEGAVTTVYDAAVALLAKTVVKTAGSTTTFYGTTEFDIVLSSKKRFVRFNYTPDINTAGTDTAITSAIAILYGADANPVTKSTALTT